MGDNSEQHSWNSFDTFIIPESAISDGVHKRAHAQMMAFVTKDLLPLAVFLRWNRLCPNALPSNVTTLIVGFFLFPYALPRHIQQLHLCHLMSERPRIHGRPLSPTHSF